jgi:hypothetical protein
MTVPNEHECTSSLSIGGNTTALFCSSDHLEIFVRITIFFHRITITTRCRKNNNSKPWSYSSGYILFQQCNGIFEKYLVTPSFVAYTIAIFYPTTVPNELEHMSPLSIGEILPLSSVEASEIKIPYGAQWTWTYVTSFHRGNITASSVAVSKIEIPYGPPLFYAVK